MGVEISRPLHLLIKPAPSAPQPLQPSSRQSLGGAPSPETKSAPNRHFYTLAKVSIARPVTVASSTSGSGKTSPRQATIWSGRMSAKSAS